jgi:tricorn protease
VTVAIAAVTLLLLQAGLGAGVAQAQQTDRETKLLRNPDVSATEIVFVYAGDLWIVDRDGGDARRLTSASGLESQPRFSPDGGMVAFTADYDGQYDVYVIPAMGGEPRRLTFHPDRDEVLDWSPDGKRILFRSGRYSSSYRFARYFTVSVDGGMPEMLPIPFGGQGGFSPDGDYIAYNPNGRERATWKRYRGGETDYVAIYGLADNSYREVHKTRANDFWPMWDERGIYFASDRDEHLNIWHYDLATDQLKQITHFDKWDVKWPALGPDAIVFELGGELNLLDLASEQTRKVPIRVRSELLVARDKFENVVPRIADAEISPNGKRAVFAARGDIWTVPAEHGPTRNLTATSGVHEREPVWSPKGDVIAYFSDEGGEWSIHLQDQKGGNERELASPKDKAYPNELQWSPDGKKLLYTDSLNRLWCVDAENGDQTLIAESEYRGGVGDATWSPDSRWVAYVRSENDNGAIQLWSIESGETTAITDDFYRDYSPAFDPDGKYLYFASSRHFYPTGDAFDWHFSYHGVDGLYGVTLAADTDSPFLPESDDEEVEKKDDEQAENGDKDDKGDKKDEKGEKDDENGDEEKGDGEEVEPIKIDVEGLGQRLFALPVEAGTFLGVVAGKGKVFYASMPFAATEMGRPDRPRGANLHVFDLEEKESKDVLSGVQAAAFSPKAEKILYSLGPGQWAIGDAGPEMKPGEKSLDVSQMQVMVDYKKEWAQLFHEAWRIERDFFWDPDMYGMNWKKIGEQYGSLLPWVAHRTDLNYLIGELIGELATGHAYVGGGDYPDREQINVGLLGVDFEGGEDYWKIARIYPGQPSREDRRSPLDEPGVEVAEGEYLIAVDGVEIPSDANPYAYFQNKAEQDVVLLINGEPKRDGAREVLVKTIGDEGELRYLAWIVENQRKVDEATDGRVGYMHVPDTSVEGLREFDRMLQGQTRKEALIVDERFNSGGMIPDFYTNKLKKQRTNYISPRNGKSIPWPPASVHGPKVMIANQFAGSGGDAFPWYFKKAKIGPVIGKTTWGGLVGISRRTPMIDGGVVTAPEIAFWSADDGWIVENVGVHPDIDVDYRPDLVAQGHDPQLEKAIEVIMAALEKEPPEPKKPPYPEGR